MSTATSSSSSHPFPPGVYSQNYNSRYADIIYSGLVFRDAHEENPESILDDHVQRVMKTPACQSPGTGRHSPKSCSPDGLKIMGLNRHPPRHGFKGETGHQHHNKHMHPHTGVGKPKELVEAEAVMRIHSSIPWSMETSHCGLKFRSYVDGLGGNTMAHLGYCNRTFLLSTQLTWFFILTAWFLLFYSNKSGTQCKRAYKKGEDVRPYCILGPTEEMEKNQKILLWLMEGQKEMVQHKSSLYGLVNTVYKTGSHTFSAPVCIVGVSYHN